MNNISFTCFTSINTQAKAQGHAIALRDATDAAAICRSNTIALEN